VFFVAAAAADKVISCWHEIPLWAGEDELHFICEIPKETSAKMEVATVRPRFSGIGFSQGQGLANDRV
jgi:alpha/beta superfamily hydrolase